MQLDVDVLFSCECKMLRLTAAIDLFADSWKVLSPLISFVLEDNDS
jgi:hypothetical protein